MIANITNKFFLMFIETPTIAAKILDEWYCPIGRQEQNYDLNDTLRKDEMLINNATLFRNTKLLPVHLLLIVICSLLMFIVLLTIFTYYNTLAAFRRQP